MNNFSWWRPFWLLTRGAKEPNYDTGYAWGSGQANMQKLPIFMFVL